MFIIIQTYIHVMLNNRQIPRSIEAVSYLHINLFLHHSGKLCITCQLYSNFSYRIVQQFFPNLLLIIAFITSKGTLDKKKPNVRKYIAQLAAVLAE